MKKLSFLLIAVAIIALVFGAYQWQRAEATENYGFNYVQHAIDVIDESNLSQTSKDNLVAEITGGAPDYQGISLDFSNSSASSKTKNTLFLFRKLIRSKTAR